MFLAVRSSILAARSSYTRRRNLRRVKSTIDVTDDGPGIPSDKVALLFQPAPYQRRVGYALILAREIALAHGGDMEVESTQDPHTHGTTVRLVLPAH